MEISLPEINLDKIRAKLEALSVEMQNAAQAGDHKLISSINPEFQSLSSLISDLESIHGLMSRYAEAEELVNDPEMHELAEADMRELEPQIRQLEAAIHKATAPVLEDDERNAIFEIRAGTGGAEASLFAEELYRMYLRYIPTLGFSVESISVNYNDEGGIKETIFRVTGSGVYSALRFESGVHRVQRVPTTESGGRIHTSAASVVVVPEAEATSVNVEDKDLKIEVYRSSGPGGQSVNTTDSAVRITHIPTGLTVTSQESKSQHRNKEQAMSVLVSRLYAIQQAEKVEKEKELRMQAIQTGDRSAKIRTYNFPQNRVTDHRVNLSWYNLPMIMEGELSELVPAVNLEIRRQLAEK